MMIEFMKPNQHEHLPDIWKSARTILRNKRGSREQFGNQRSITSIQDRVIFCRIFQGIHEVREEISKQLCDTEQKGFIPKKARRLEHTEIVKVIINDAVEKKK